MLTKLQCRLLKNMMWDQLLKRVDGFVASEVEDSATPTHNPRIKTMLLSLVSVC